MAEILVKHTVEDFEQWKSRFDEDASTREEYGERGYNLFRVSEDPNEIVILLHWDSVENAERFVETSDLAEVYESGGRGRRTRDVLPRRGRIESSRRTDGVTRGRVDRCSHTALPFLSYPPHLRYASDAAARPAA